MEEQRLALVAEQISHALDLLRAEIEGLRSDLLHERALVTQRLEALETRANDQEMRLRAATDGVVQFKVWSGLTSGGSSLLSLIALLRAFLHGG